MQDTRNGFVEAAPTTAQVLRFPGQGAPRRGPGDQVVVQHAGQTYSFSSREAYYDAVDHDLRRRRPRRGWLVRALRPYIWIGFGLGVLAVLLAAVG